MTLKTVTTSLPTEEGIPVVVESKSNMTLAESLEWIERETDSLLDHVNRHGVVLFRNFPIRTPVDFDSFVTEFGWENFPYEKSLSNAVRVNKTDRVFTANEAPPEIEIFLHHEMAQTPLFPERIFFCCLDAADSGGQTPICRSDILLERLAQSNPDFVRDCEAKGLKYSNVMPAENDFASGMGRSWQSTLSVDSKDSAESRLQAMNYSWEWFSGDSLRVTTPVLPAIRELSNGKRSFFNQLIAAFRGWKDSRNDPSKSLRHGDDTPLDTSAVESAIELAYEITHDVAWQPGDVALVDNLMVMHGRRPFTGSRSVLASLTAPTSH